MEAMMFDLHVNLHVITAVLIMLSAGFLIACKKYQDGIIGRFGLGIMCFSSGMILLRWFEHYPYEPTQSEIAMNIGIVIFLCWHCVRFTRRILREGTIKRRRSDSPLMGKS